MLAALQLYTRQMNRMGKVRGKSALGSLSGRVLPTKKSGGDLDISVNLFISPTDIKSSQLS